MVKTSALKTQQSVINAFLASGSRVKRAQFKDGRFTKAFQTFNLRLIRQGSASWYFDPDMRVVDRQVVPRVWLGTATLNVNVIYQSGESSTIVENVNVSASGNKQSAQNAINRAVDEFIHHLRTRPSPVKEVLAHQVSNVSIVEQIGHQDLIGNGTQEILTGYLDGRAFMPEGVSYGCAYYAIEHRYGRIKGWIKQAKKHVVFNLFNGTQHASWDDVVANQPDTHADRLRYYGVNCSQLVKWGEYTNTSVYVIDEMLCKLACHFAVNPRTNRPLAMLIKDGHWYLLEDSKKLHSLGARFSPYRLTGEPKKDSEQPDETPKTPAETAGGSTPHPRDNMGDRKGAQPPTFVELSESRAWDELCSIVSKSGVLPDQKSIKLDGRGKILQMKIADTTYIVKTDSQRFGKRFCELNDTPWNGESLNAIISQMVGEELGTYKSSPPPSTTQLLNDKKDFNHYGPTPHFFEMLSKSNKLPADSYCYDIRSQDYTSMVRPAEPWYVMDFKSIPTPVPQGDLPFGFYYIKTDDMRMAVGSGLYCRAFTLKMLYERLCTREQLLYYIPVKTKSHTAVMRLFNRIDAATETDKTLNKIARNTVAGILGMSKTSRGFGRMARFENSQEAMNYFVRYHAQKPIFTPNTDQTHILYGDLRSYTRTTHYLPMYFQQIQFGLMRLYQHLKPYWRQVGFRKRDAFTIIGEHIPPPLGDDIGQLKTEDTPVCALTINKFNVVPEPPPVPILQPKWTNHRGLISSDAEEVFALLKEHQGCEIDAPGGYGKTYLANKVIELAKEQGWRVACAAFTNQASNNLKGTTIHKLFGMGLTDTTPDLKVAAALSKAYDLIVFDEKSMIPGMCWFAISQLTCRVMIVGDWRQIPPVNEQKYNNHPEIHRICKGQRVILKRGPKVRYDLELEEASNNVMTHPIKFSKTITDRNICWSNRCVVRVNELVLSKKIGARWSAPATPEAWKDIGGDKAAWAGKRWDVMIGQPLFAAKPISTNIPKNERLSVKAVQDGNILLEEDEEVSVAIKDFWECFRPGYASTTHKAQGATITEDYSIYEWSRMDKDLRYTAMTRAKSLQQIHFH